jgi:hypothetical protein
VFSLPLNAQPKKLMIQCLIQNIMDTRLTEKKANRLEIILDENIYLKLKQFCENEATTPFIASLAAFKILLQRYTEQDNIIVDVLSTDSVVLQTSLTDNPTVKALLTRLNQTVTETPNLPIKLAPRRIPFEVSKIFYTKRLFLKKFPKAFPRIPIKLRRHLI